ncbi:MAG: TIGR01777 family oxidoreductase [Actinobacteria bacterium]|nr:TIGR01777 family oxidoreductase [Actinomycetota bacterium]
MNVLISGATGLIGTALGRHLSERGDNVWRLGRRPSAPGAQEMQWDPAAGRIDLRALPGPDAVVHLAGENIGAGRWSAAKKARIRYSRVRGTALLAEALVRLPRPPRVLVCASASGYYGERGDATLDESSGAGAGFLADVARAWEAAAEPARQAGMRVVHCRTAPVLSARGGALAPMLWPYRLGLGGPLGSGRQWFSWVALDDVVRAYAHVLDRVDLAAAVNVASPQPVRQRDFARALGRVLRRPAIFPVPALALRAFFGEVAREMLLVSQRVVPVALRAHGFAFAYPDLETALRHVLGRR